MSFLGQPISITALIAGRSRSIADIEGYITVKEETTDSVMITKHPVQTGAAITDHSFKEPVILTMQIMQQPTGFQSFLDNGSLTTQSFNGRTGLQSVYKKFLDLQAARTPFTVTTPKRTYKNMLLAAIGVTTDKQTENTVALTLSFQEILIVEVGQVTVPAQNQARPQATQPTKKVGKKSALKLLGEGLGIGT